MFEKLVAEMPQVVTVRAELLELRIDLANNRLSNVTTGEQWPLKPLGEVAPIIAAGGVFAYARQEGLLKT